MDAEHVDFPADKIPNPELYQMAAQGEDGQASVLIALNLPVQRVQIERPPHQGSGPMRRSFVDESESGLQSAQKTIDEAGSYLRNLLGETPRWLNAARVFVASVTPEQLRAVARSPLIKTIHLNRHLKS